MINVGDQEQLFSLIADYLTTDVECICIGGTAMMFMGSKNLTKDIDLVFPTVASRAAFIDAIEALGYKQRSMRGVYHDKQLVMKGKPMMYSRGEERFDLFVKTVLGMPVSKDNIRQRQDFIGKKELIVLVPSEEQILLMKSVTNREKDFEDMESLVKNKPLFDWDYVIDKAIKQRKHQSWILLDLEEKMQRLSKICIIKKEFFSRIYKAEEAQP
ncbi:MAG: DUF6036 family nucleotidyltransferase [Nanoarchaeota archaeon]